MEFINTNNDIYDIIIENEIRKWKSSMINNLQPTTWETPKYSKKQIDRAGKIIADPTSSEQDKNEALEIINNWRSSHAYPLQIITSHLIRKNNNAIVVQRLKRLDSIIGKLERNPDMSLYRMQDLGGCRVIVDTINQVYEAVDRYKNSRIRHILKREYNYIQKPKDSGYRSYHMVYQFQSDKKETYNKNMLIEIQFRTKLQHIWATAVEMMGIYTKSNLKSSQGNEEILRFFTLVASIIAIQEEQPVCPNTSTYIDELVTEIKYLNEKHHIISTLESLNVAIVYTSNIKINNKNAYYILILDYIKRKVSVKTFKSSNIEIATKVYSQIENKTNNNVVLVSASSFDLLREAYPNYFVDISKFINILDDILNNYDYIMECSLRQLMEN